MANIPKEQDCASFSLYPWSGQLKKSVQVTCDKMKLNLDVAWPREEVHAAASQPAVTVPTKAAVTTSLAELKTHQSMGRHLAQEGRHLVVTCSPH